MNTPETFASDTRRITGMEEECVVAEARIPTDADRKQRLAELGIKIVGKFLSNGGAIHRYEGEEYNTPECDNPLTTAHAVSAGDEIVRRTANKLPKIPDDEWADFTEERKRLERKQRFPILRLSGSYDLSSIGTRGCHENYLFPWPESEEKLELLAAVLDSYLATRPVWDGSGMMTKDGYLISQKAPGIGTRIILRSYGHHRTTGGSKPLGALLSPQNDAIDKISEGWGLFEVRSGDSHMSITRRYIGLAGTSLVMRLVERDVINEHNAAKFIIKKPVETLHKINSQYGQGPIELESGETTTAAGLQTHYFEEVLEHAIREPFLNIELDAAKNLVRINQKLGSTALEKAWRDIAVDVEWAAKAHYFRREQENKSYTGPDVATDKLRDAVMFHLLWHSIEEGSIGLAKYARLDPEHTKPVDLFLDPNSRATARGKAIADDKCISAQWNYLSMKGIGGVRLNNYYRTDLPDPDKI